MKFRALCLVAVSLALVGCATTGPVTGSFYEEADFTRVQKMDAHVHANVFDPSFLELARQNNFTLLSINVDYSDFPDLAVQADVAERMHAAAPDVFSYATTFPMDGFGTPGWDTRTIAHIDKALANGAIGVKIWKNIGMAERDSDGIRVFIDDPRFNPVMDHLIARGVPLLAHQAEPRNAWLPLDRMTTLNDLNYFRDHPEYHMFLHSEEPSYEELLAARDRFVERHPELGFVGVHLASLEWSVDELADFLDRYPWTAVDMAARMSNLQVQSNEDRDRVRAFMIEYQDRIFYATDLTDSPPDADGPAQNPSATGDFLAQAERVWRMDWRYLATPLAQHVDAIDADVMGLQLPSEVIDKIYWTNARRYFGLSQRSPS